MNPILATIIQFTSCLTDYRWETRQAASHGLTIFIKEIIASNKHKNKNMFEYAVIEEDGKSEQYRLVYKKVLDFDKVVCNLLTRVVI